MLGQIVANGIPAYLVGGEFDIFQNGEPLNYAALQNAYDGRPTTAPMLPGQRTTGRYQLIDGPWEHVNGSSVDVDPLELEWFDTWLKGENTGMATTPTPLHYYDLGSGQLRRDHDVPVHRIRARRPMYFGAGGHVAAPPNRRPERPAATPIDWSPVGQPVRPAGRPVVDGRVSPSPRRGRHPRPLHRRGQHHPARPVGDELHHGAPGQGRHRRRARSPPPCTPAPTRPRRSGWPRSRRSRPTAPRIPLTEGALLGSLRAVDPSRSWTRTGSRCCPITRYTQASAEPVVPGAIEKYQIQVFPTLATLAAGDRLRVTIATTDTPHLVPTPSQLTQLIGGQYSIQRTPASPSSLTVELDPVLS